MAGDYKERMIVLGAGCAPVPERLLLAHAQGKVLFVTGAGSSAAANLPDFRKLVLQTYEKVDTPAHAVLGTIPSDGSLKGIKLDRLNAKQRAEINQFCRSYFDVAIGMLERRIDGAGTGAVTVRECIAEILRSASKVPAPIHRALVQLADRGGAISIATTNFDLLLEAAAARQKTVVQSYSLGAIPRPSRSTSFAGVLHIHGALEPDANRISDFIVSDQDFGEFYLRRRIVPDFIYDAARLFNLVLVGYSANDPPMRYLLNAVAADGSRFEDFKERFVFIGGDSPADPVMLEEWLGRGITPIHYDSSSSHAALLVTLQRWASISAINGKRTEIDKLIRRLVRKPRALANDQDRDLFDHLFRRADRNERLRLTRTASTARAALDWLDAIAAIAAEREGGL